MALVANVSAIGAIPDLATLKTVLADELNRDDLTTKFARFIVLAEAHFNRHLRSPEMEHSITLTASTADTPLPSDFLSMRSIYVNGTPRSPLKSMAPAAIIREFSDIAGTPLAFALVSGNLRIAPTPSAPVLLSMDYYSRIVPLSDAAPSNWLLFQHPDLYLYRTLFHAEANLGNEAAASGYKGFSDEILAEINRVSNSNRFGGGPIVPNAVGQVRGRAKC